MNCLAYCEGPDIKKREDFWMAEGRIFMTKLILYEIKKKKRAIRKHFEKGFGESLMTQMVPKDRKVLGTILH